MIKVDAQKVKAESRGLRGSITSELGEETPRFSEEAASLLKFHGTYQQEDRDARKAAREAGVAEKSYAFMIRIKATAGRIPAELWSAVDDLADRLGNGTIRITTRQALQLHGPLLHPLFQLGGVGIARLHRLRATGSRNRYEAAQALHLVVARVFARQHEAQGNQCLVGHPGAQQIQRAVERRRLRRSRALA